MESNTPHQHYAPLMRADENVFTLSVGHMRLIAQGKLTELVQEGVHGNNDLRGAILVFMAGSRNEKMVEAAQKVGFIERLKSGVGEKVYLFLWTRMHEDMLWLADQSDA